MSEAAKGPDEIQPPSVGDGKLLVAFLLSGFAGLGYEVLWTRLLGIALGSEILAVFGVLAGYFVGVALGALLLQPLARRMRHPLLLFAVLEGAAALFAALSPSFLHSMATTIPEMFGPQMLGTNAGASPVTGLAQSIAVAAVLLLPGTLAVGGTMAAIVEAHRRVRKADPGGRSVGQLYGANTLGAVLGTLAAVYLLLPKMGFSGTAILLASSGVVSAFFALAWGLALKRAGFTSEPMSQLAAAEAAATTDLPDRTRSSRIGLYLLFFCTGMIGVGFEVVAVQIVGQGLENTVFTFANILAVFLTGTSCGAWAYSRLARPAAAHFHLVSIALLAALSLAVFVTAAALDSVPALADWVAPPTSGYGRHLLAELLVATATFLLPTALMGALFSHILGALANRAAGFGYAANTLGSAAAPFVFGLIAIPSMGYSGSFYGVAYAYLLVLAGYAAFAFRRPYVVAAMILAVVAGEAIAPVSLGNKGPGPDWKVLFRKEGMMGSVSVLERNKAKGNKERQSGRRLQLGLRYRMGGERSFGERRMGHIPLLLTSARIRQESGASGTPGGKALFLGVGTGATLSAVLAYPALTADAVELVPEVVSALPYFSAINQHVHRASRVSIKVADARRFVAGARTRYELIVADLFHPARDGAAQLFALEHYQTVRKKLLPGGLFVQWLPLYQIAPRTLRLIIRTFLTAFPGDVHSFLGLYHAKNPILALVAHNRDGTKLALDARRLKGLFSRSDRSRYVQSAADLLGSYMLHRQRLARFAGKGPINSDLNPRLLFEAPQDAYSRGASLSYESFAELFALRQPFPPTLLRGAHADVDALRRSIFPYARAVGLYLQAELGRVRRDDRQHLSSEIDMLLAAFEAAPDFAPAQGLLLSIAKGQKAFGERILSRMAAHSGSLRVQMAYYEQLVRSGKSAEAAALKQSITELLKTQRRRPTPKAGPSPMAPTGH